MKPTIEYPDFEKVDLRVGLITEATMPDWSNKLIQFTVDFGPEIGVKTILSGVKKWYTPADFLSKKFPFVVNLAERKMGQAVSQGMMIMATSESKDEEGNMVEGAPVIFSLPDQTVPGSVIR
ncbi:hypothetical protein BH10PAT2_BH10PAT2_0220 [soil metagenome]